MTFNTKIWHHNWYLKNKAKVQNQTHLRYLKNRVKLLQQGAIWRENNKERMKNLVKEYRKKNSIKTTKYLYSTNCPFCYRRIGVYEMNQYNTKTGVTAKKLIFGKHERPYHYINFSR